MIEFERLTYTYPNTARPALENFSLHIPAGAFVLVSGLSGSGKSTLLRAINGLVPHFYGGRFVGRVRVNGLDTVQASPREMAATVGFVFQEPSTQFVVPGVEDELAFGLENLGIAPDQMPPRMSEALAAVGAEHLRHRQIATLSGGEAQRIAIACALVMRPLVLVLDEPTSQLDPPSAANFLEILARLHQHYQLTIVLAEHRLGRILPLATHLLALRPDAPPLFGAPHDIITQSELRPPFIEAALHFGWNPLPRSIAEAREIARQSPLPTNETTPIDITPNRESHAEGTNSSPMFGRGWEGAAHEPIVSRQPNETTPTPTSTPKNSTNPILRLVNLTAGYETQSILRDINLTLYPGECIAILGANGTGKSTLLKTLAGLLKPHSGQIFSQNEDITQQRIDQSARLIAYVPQDPASVLFADTLLDELRFTLHGLKVSAPIPPTEFLQDLGLGDYAERYPRDLSGGERQRAALAAMLIAERPILLLDEPTMGLDYRQRQRLVNLLAQWKKREHGILLATHDLELAARVSDRILILSDGQIAYEGTPREILLNTAGYQTQLAQIFGNPALLTTDDLQPV